MVSNFHRQRFYRSTSGAYDSRQAARRYAQKLLPQRRPPIRRALDDSLLLLSQGSSILDVGCGTGKDVATLRQKGYRAFGLDKSSEMVRLARERYGDFFLQGDMLDLGAMSNMRWDGIISVAAMQHIFHSDMPAVVTSLSAMLNSDGIALIITKRGRGIGADHRLGRNFPRLSAYYEPNQLTSAMCKHGMTVRWVRRFELFREGRMDSWFAVLAKSSVID